MNDWLDYKGSGSSRACIAHYGVKGMKWDPSKLFGNPKESDEQLTKQKNADIRLLNAKKEQLESLRDDMRNAELKAQAMSKKINESKELKKQYETALSEIQLKDKVKRTVSPLRAHQQFAESEWAYKEYIKAMDDKIAKEKDQWSKYSNLHSELKSKVLKLTQEIDNLEKSLNR